MHFQSTSVTDAWRVFTVETRVVRLKEKINQLLKDVDNSYNMALIKLPKAVRQMVWLERCSKLTQAHRSDLYCLCLKREKDYYCYYF